MLANASIEWKKIARLMAKLYVLDASALLHFVDDDSGAARVERLIQKARQTTPLLISMVNWGEVFYHQWQERGEETARRTMSSLLAFRLILFRLTCLRS
jgi:PIN domain nuclease of toxin-antitoxin system